MVRCVEREMKFALRFAVLITSLAAEGRPAEAQTTNEIQFKTSDQLTVFGDFHASAKVPARAVLIVVHQGDGSARGDYGPIIPRLIREGFDVLAIDSRSGGELFGSTNRTVSKNPARDWEYCDAYPDLTAALDYAKTLRPARPIIVWGSSYSATLALRLAADRASELKAVLAFSPASGPSMGECQPVPYAARVKIPALVVRPRGELDVAMRRADFDAFSKQGHQTYIAEPSAHGSSVLVAERANGDASATWITVLAFLDKVLGK